MSGLRVLARALALAAWSAGFAGGHLAGRPLAAGLGRSRAWRERVFRSWAWGTARIIGMRIRREGSAPGTPCLLVANHLSYVDVVLLAASLPCAFVSKAEVARWPVLGPLARSMGTLFVDRSRKRGLSGVAAAMRARLAAGETLVLFPEGTSTAGGGVTSFRSSLLEPAAELGLPVRYAALRYQTPPGAPLAAQAVAWWGERTFLDHLLELLRLPSFEARLVFGADALHDSDRKRLAARLQRAVTRCFQPMVTHV
jgi:1-acyl-sn-glycerol-3-phosphate acyltransferase